MTADNPFRGLRALVTGVGRYRLGSNNSAARFLARQGARVTVSDPKPAEELAIGLKHLRGLKAAFHLGGYRPADFRSAEIVIKNQGNRALESYLRSAKRARVTTDVGLFMSLAPAVPTVGITGTRGKSTTTALLGQMIDADGCRGYVGGNMKVSPLNFLSRLLADHRQGRCAAVVLELSSWLLEGWKEEGIAPAVAVVTNVFPDHLNTYASYADYVYAKTEIFRAQGEDGLVVLNRGNAETRKMARLAPGRVFWFSRKPFAGRGAYAAGGRIVWQDGRRETVARLADIRYLRGEHNLENVLAAVVAAKLIGVKNSSIVRTLRSFRGLPDRQEFVRCVGGVAYINDTTATSPDGAEAALKAFGRKKKRIVLIAGGKDKDLDFRGLAKMIKKTVKSLILFEGTATVRIMKELKRLKFEYDLAPVVKDMKTAVKLARSEAKKGDIVLLSPGAASFGLFQNEFDRGAQFVKAVKAL